MAERRMMRIGTFLAGTGSNMASWRHPTAVPDAAINLEYYRRLTRKAENAKLDFAFFGDGLYISEKSHPNFLNRFRTPYPPGCPGHGYLPHRAGGHPLHDLQRSLHGGAAIYVH